ncbi:MAG: hypothetical protein KF691_02185 [Phycisphaeraceae bacterium]|nr:hypothetical protein [Phycisphaeraceae bacterium]
MSGRVCYVARADRGSRIESLRLVGARTDEAWAVPLAPAQNSDAGDGELFDERGIVAAADWVKSRTLGGKARSGSLSLLCLDAEGFSAGWITSPSTERRVVASVASAGIASEEAGSAVGPGLGFYFPSDTESGVQPLAVATEPETKVAGVKVDADAVAPTAALRVPVLVGADAPVRLLLDLLDQRSILVESVTTIWHAMARVWGEAPSDRANVVTEDSGVAAIILIDQRGRLLWCWTAKGELLAGGSMRLATPDAVGRAPSPTAADAARLTNDWIAWGSQLGVVPRRVACIAADDPVGVGEDSASFRAGQFGAKLAGTWGGAGVDLVLDQDPIGATLARLASATADARPDEAAIAGLDGLSHRPGKLHKRMHVWVALGILGGALLSAGAAWKLRASVGLLTEAAQSEDSRWRELIQTSYPNIMKLPNVEPEDELNKILRREEQERERNKIEPMRPIIQELETLSLALADPEVDLESIDISAGANASVIINVLTPDIKQAENVYKAITAISGSNIESWQQPSFSNAGTKIKGVFTGKWRNPKAGAPAPSVQAPRPAPPSNPTSTPARAASPTVSNPAPVTDSGTARPRQTPTQPPGPAGVETSSPIPPLTNPGQGLTQGAPSPDQPADTPGQSETSVARPRVPPATPPGGGR